ncbi:MAG: hypothetical protein JWO57_2934 [Pseudonocardiales bacterium]|nr:hypothetical protein [Pseudonocardiales bacterium]
MDWFLTAIGWRRPAPGEGKRIYVHFSRHTPRRVWVVFALGFSAAWYLTDKLISLL